MKNPFEIPSDFRYLSRGTQLDMSNCDREPVHLIDRIQVGSWVYVLAGEGVDSASLRPMAVSEDIKKIAGIEAAAFLKQSLKAVLGSRLTGLVKETFHNQDTEPKHLYEITFPWLPEQPFDVTLHRSGDHVVLEWSNADDYAPCLVDYLREAMAGIEDLPTLCDKACGILKRYLQAEHVILYRFDNNFNGEGLAERKETDLPGYKGRWFPDSDIPVPARVVMAKRPVGLVVDHYAAGTPLVCLGEKTEIDLSRAVCRSPSVMCSRYYRNMGVQSSGVCSLMHKQRLWGFFSFWYFSKTARIGANLRRELRIFGQAFMNLVQALQIRANRRVIAALKQRHRSLLEHMSNTGDMEGAFREVSHLLDMMPSDGVALVFPDHIVGAGDCPPDPFIRKLAAWLQTNHSEVPIYDHRNLSSVYAAAKEHRDKASGLLAMRLGIHGGTYLIWFRGELLQKIEWAGEPVKKVDPLDPDDRLMPRASFSLWVEQAEGYSAQWQTHEIDLAEALRNEMLRVLH